VEKASIFPKRKISGKYVCMSCFVCVVVTWCAYMCWSEAVVSV
jgi:hypothetical protein